MPTDEPTSRKRVLLVEDDDIVRMLTAEILEEFGYSVEACSDASSALAFLRQGETVDLLMSDVGLPDLDGHELAEAARALRPDLAVLFASGYDEQRMLADVRQRHPQARTESIVKPFDLTLLAERLERLTSV